MRFPDHIEFDPYGGYDAMSSGYDVKDKDDKTLFTIECLCNHWYVDGNTTYPHGDHEECPTAKELAQFICNFTEGMQ